jgi:hypothetical protein
MLEIYEQWVGDEAFEWPRLEISDEGREIRGLLQFLLEDLREAP